MTRYHKLSETELNDLLIISFFPKKKERLNLYERDIFNHTIVQKIIENNLKEEFGEQVLFFTKIEVRNKQEIHSLIIDSFLLDLKIFKMAALKLYDEYKEFIK